VEEEMYWALERAKTHIESLYQQLEAYGDPRRLSSSDIFSRIVDAMTRYQQEQREFTRKFP
jgi:hypothetical protein